MMTAITVAAGKTQPQITSATAPSDEDITGINPTLLYEWHKFYKEFSQSNRNNRNDTLAPAISAINDTMMQSNPCTNSTHPQ